KCGQVIIPDFVLRNLAAYPNEINKGRQLIAKADLLIIVGTKRNSSSFLKNIPKIVVNKELKSESKDNLINVSGDANSIFKYLNARLF
ncbi:MAG TPA: NAD-dependent deacetylase, partial [Lactobacillus acetotolerans]|nr:NAD-dependent deacetylase [Lactobacillus acetotolerans]